MPVNSCSDGGKPGYKWGDAGKCYIYSSNDEKSKAAAKKKAIAQGIAIGDIAIKNSSKEKIMSYTENMSKMATDHSSMRDWHEEMAKSAVEMMQNHIKAAAWHSAQADMIKGMINDVPLDPEKKVTSIPTAGSAPAPTSGAGYTSPSKEVPLDPDTVKKSDLVDLLKGYEDKFGKFDIDVDTIAEFLIAE